MAKARDELLKEIRRMGGQDVVITTNIAVRRDGFPYANQKNPEDTGVAVYFWHKGEMRSIGCDQFIRLDDNIRAIGLSIAAYRGLDRWGGTGLIQEAVNIFGYLPSGGMASESAPGWWSILQVDRTSSWQTVRDAWRRRVLETHPDQGGSADEYRAVHDAFEEAMEEKGQAAR